MSVSRRSFLQIAAAASGSIVALPALGKEPPGPAPDGFGVLVDATYCVGCRKCEWGCNQANELSTRGQKSFEDKSVFANHRRPEATAFTVVNQIGQAPDGATPLFAKVQCMHCQRPACASACIVGALKKTPEGPVTYDASKCIGCRYCMVACPFQIPAYEYADPLTPRVMKCSFCYERIVNQAKRPACVENCPNEALTFGLRSELVALARNKLGANPERYNGHVFGEHEIGGTSWMYLSKVDFTALDLPVLGDEPIPKLTETIQHAVFKGFVPPVALYGLLGLVMWSRRREEAQQKAEQPTEAHHE